MLCLSGEFFEQYAQFNGIFGQHGHREEGSLTLSQDRALYFRGKGVFIGLAFVAIGSFMVFSVARQWLTGMQSRSWEPVEAVVVASDKIDVTLSGSEGRTHTVPELDFRYRYEVDGRSYESDRLSFEKNEVDVRDIPNFIRKHPEGDPLTVYYNRKHPEQAVVKRGVPAAGILFIVMPGFFVVLGPVLIWGSVTGAIVRFCEKRGLWYR